MSRQILRWWVPWPGSQDLLSDTSGVEYKLLLWNECARTAVLLISGIGGFAFHASALGDSPDSKRVAFVSNTEMK